MGSPMEALPTVTVDAISNLLPTINLPEAESIAILSTTAEYHEIAMLKFQEDDDLVLRIAGSHVPKIKTENEVTVISWLQQNTTIPVPDVVRYDTTTNNPMGCEYLLQKRIRGQSLDLVWPTLHESERLGAVDFIADVLEQLTSHEWHHIGSLKLKNGYYHPGPVLDERFWEDRDIKKMFPGETMELLNPLGPYSSYVDFSVARLEKYMYCIRKHESLAFMREYLNLIEDFIAALNQSAAKLNRTKLCLAHRDLHMGNIMYDVETKKVTGILDWEFSIVMPLQQGDPSRALLHDLQNDGSWAERKRKMLATTRKRGGAELLDQYEYVSKDQEAMQNAVDFLRAIVEVSPRGQREKEKMDWMRELIGIMEGFVRRQQAL